MATVKEQKLAQSVYKSICDIFDGNNWKYQKDEENLAVYIGINGDDLPMAFKVSCDVDRQVLRVISQLPFKIEDDKKFEGALLLSLINYMLVEGNFDYDIFEGDVMFRSTTSFKESLISKDLIEYMFQVAISTVDDYNDLLYQFNQGELSLQDAVAKL